MVLGLSLLMMELGHYHMFSLHTVNHFKHFFLCYFLKLVKLW